MDVSVVIPTYNQATLLRHCLRALSQQTIDAKRYEIIVVDDGSTDDTPDVARELQGGPMRVRSMRLPVNRGRSAARNEGIRAAQAPLIIFIDSDIVVTNPFLAAHLRAHAEQRSPTLSRGPVVIVDEITAAGRVRPSRLAASPAFLDTANAGMARQVLVNVGMFDEGFQGYGWEDFDLGQRLRRAGVRRVFCPEAIAWHVQPSPRPEMLPVLLRKESDRAKSAVYFLQKNPTAETRWLIQWTVVHRTLYWLMSLGGRLTPRLATVLAQRLQRRGLGGLAYLVLRSALNKHYLESVRQELSTHAALA